MSVDELDAEDLRLGEGDRHGDIEVGRLRLCVAGFLDCFNLQRETWLAG